MAMEFVMFVSVSRSTQWLLLALSMAVPALATAAGCQVAYFKAQAMAIHNTQDRVTMTHDWLRENIPSCSPSQLRNIMINSPMWLGTALTPKIAGLLEAAIEAKSMDDASAVEKLLEPPTRKSEQALAEVIGTAPKPPRNLTKPGAVMSQDNAAVMSQAATVAAAAATAAAIVQGQTKPAPPPPGGGKPAP
jgi:hypothetical protein